MAYYFVLQRLQSGRNAKRSCAPLQAPIWPRGLIVTTTRECERRAEHRSVRAREQRTRTAARTIRNTRLCLLDAFLTHGQTEVVPCKFGHGGHLAQPDFGDCFSYATMPIGCSTRIGLRAERRRSSSRGACSHQAGRAACSAVRLWRPRCARSPGRSRPRTASGETREDFARHTAPLAPSI